MSKLAVQRPMPSIEGVEFTQMDFNLKHADWQSSTVHKFDVANLFAAHRLLNGTFDLLLEPLTDLEIFEEKYFPLVDSKYPLAYFELSKPFFMRRYEKHIDPDLSSAHQSALAPGMKSKRFIF